MRRSTCPWRSTRWTRLRSGGRRGGGGGGGATLPTLGVSAGGEGATPSLETRSEGGLPEGGLPEGGLPEGGSVEGGLSEGGCLSEGARAHRAAAVTAISRGVLKPSSRSAAVVSRPVRAESYACCGRANGIVREWIVYTGAPILNDHHAADEVRASKPPLEPPSNPPRSPSQPPLTPL